MQFAQPYVPSSSQDALYLQQQQYIYGNTNPSFGYYNHNGVNTAMHAVAQPFRQGDSNSYDYENDDADQTDDEEDEDNGPATILVAHQPKYQCTSRYQVMVADSENDTKWHRLESIVYDSAPDPDLDVFSQRCETWNSIERYNFVGVAMEAGRKYFTATGEPFFFLWVMCPQAKKTERSLRCAMYVQPLDPEILKNITGYWQIGGQELTLDSVFKVISKKDQPLSKDAKEKIRSKLAYAIEQKRNAFMELCNNPTVGPNRAAQCIYAPPEHFGDICLRHIKSKNRLVAMYNPHARKQICLTGDELDEHLNNGLTADDLFQDADTMSADSQSFRSNISSMYNSQDGDGNDDAFETTSYQCAQLWKRGGHHDDEDDEDDDEEDREDSSSSAGFPSSISFGAVSSVKSEDLNLLNLENTYPAVEDDDESSSSESSNSYSYDEDDGGSADDSESENQGSDEDSYVIEEEDVS